MRTYKEFFQDEFGPMADIVFVSCCVTDAAEPLLPSGGAAPRRQVVVGGRRIKTVDVHAHCAVPEAMALMGSKVSPHALLLGPDWCSSIPRASRISRDGCGATAC
jgi:hypothetical protein